MAMDLKEKYDELKETLDVIDEKLDSRDGGAGTIRTSILKQLIADTEPNWGKILAQLVEHLSAEDVTDRARIGFYYGLVRGLDKKFGKEARKSIETEVEQAPKVEPLISEEEVEPLMEQRKKVYAMIKSLREMAELFGDEDLEDMEPPRRRGGAPKGKRGPRQLSYFTWEIEGAEYANLKEVIEAVPVYDRVADLTAAMRAAKIDTSKPGDTITFELPDGRNLIGTKSADAPATDDSADDENGDDDGTDPDDE
jgi:DNA-binding ferritin-like protein